MGSDDEDSTGHVRLYHSSDGRSAGSLIIVMQTAAPRLMTAQKKPTAR